MGSQVSNANDESGMSNNADGKERGDKNKNPRVYSLFSYSDSEWRPNEIELSENDGADINPVKIKKVKKTKKSNYANVWFRWNFGGDKIFLVGSFTGWKEHLPMEKNGDEATKILKLERKEHYYKFIVDGDWRFAPDQQTVADHNGNINNIIDLNDLKDADEEEEEEEEEEEDKGSEIGNQAAHKQEDTCLPMNGYNQEIPKISEFTQEPPIMPYNLSKNILDEAIKDIPLHNPEYSKEFIKSQKDTKIEPIFKDRNLPIPTHISLNHAFFCDTNWMNTTV